MAKIALSASPAHRVCRGPALASTPAHGMRHAALVAGFGRQFADGVRQSGASVAGRHPHASRTPCDQGSDDVLPAGRVLLHAFRHADHLAVPVRPDADGCVCSIGSGPVEHLELVHVRW
jgi:hypothetical protein